MTPRAEVFTERRLDPIDPIAQCGAGPARIDQIVDPEGLRPIERRSLGRKGILEFATVRFWIRSGCDFATERDRYAALEWEGSAFGGGPRHRVALDPKWAAAATP